MPIRTTQTQTGSAGRQAEGAPSPALAPPPGNPRFPLFDGLRGIAVIGILAFHTFEVSGKLGLSPLGKTAEVAGTQAVLWFFAISGFLLYRPYAVARWRGGPAPRTARYARRRALRILPGYWTILTILALYPGISGVFSGDWWRYYGYLQLYWSRTVTGGIPVAWTLCVEVSFYLALPLWAAALRRLPRRHLLAGELVPLACVAAAGAAVQVAADRRHVPHLLASSLAGQITWIALGMGLAALSVAADREGIGARLRHWAGRAGLCWSVGVAAFAAQVALAPGGGVFGLVAAVQTPQPLGRSVIKVALEVVTTVAYLLPAVFGGEDRRGVPRRILAARPVVWLGVVSYSFYLWHFTVIEFIARSHLAGAFSATGLGLMDGYRGDPTFVLFVASFAAVGLLSAISYRFVELPFLRRKG